MTQRIPQLDWLRGLMALSIFIYHFSGFALNKEFDSGSILGRLGVYGVSVFFVLSGLSMALAYHGKLGSRSDVLAFATRRVFRILPLMWFAIGLQVILAYPHTYPLKLLVVNLTCLFGFVAPTAYILMGAWSIGNEVVYYALTPLLIWGFERSKVLGNAIFTLTITVGLYFAFAALAPYESITVQWKTYVNPFNNLFLYTAGVALFYNCRNWQFEKSAGWLLLGTVGVFCLYPVTGDQITIVTGLPRVIFAVLAILAVLVVWKLPAYHLTPLSWLGDGSYAIYLLHPLACAVAFQKLYLSGFLLVAGCFGLTFALSWFSYRFIEKPGMRFGKKVSNIFTPLHSQSFEIYAISRPDKKAVQNHRRY